MLRIVVFLLAVSALAFGLSWLADRPGTLLVEWQGYQIETSVFRAIVILALIMALCLVLWSVLRQVWQSPAVIGSFFNRRRQKKGLEALSSGMIAIGAGDRSLATRYALQARKSLPNEPLTHLLRAQAAQLSGDRATARRIFEAMLSSPDTEQLGLRGLFLEAEKEKEAEAARQFAERALALNPKLAWPVEALFDIQCKAGDWAGALGILSVAKRHNHFERAVADRRRAVLLTAQAQEAEDGEPDRAMSLALEAHNLARNLVPAAAIAGRILAARGNTPKAVRVLQRTWKRSQHPDLATAYAYARIGDSPRDRLERVKQLAAMRPYSIESPIAVANAAIEARDWDTARHALQPLLEGRLTQRVCTLMARIEGEQHGNAGAVREWLARAVNAPRDPAWTADGVVSDHWAPVSPVTGALDAFQWRVPVEALEKPDAERISRKLEELVKLGARPEVAIAAPASEAKPAQVHPQSGLQEAEARTIDVTPEVAPAPPSPAARPAPPEPKPATPSDASVSVAARTSTPQAEVAQDRAPPRPAEPATRSVPISGSRVPEERPDRTTQGPAKQAKGPSQPQQPRMFVPQRAPDDPGPEAPDAAEDNKHAPIRYPFTAKGQA